MRWSICRFRSRHAGQPDAAPVGDGGPVDAGQDDGLQDAGPIDTGPIDAGLQDAGPIDAGAIDAGAIDANEIDAGTSDSGPKLPAKVAYVSGNSQSAIAGATLNHPFTVLVTDSTGTPVGGVTVTWAAAFGGGSVAATSDTAMLTGLATVTATLGSFLAIDTFTASVSGLAGSPVTYEARAVAGAPTPTRSLIAVSPATVTADGISFATVTLKLADANGNPCAGQPVVLSMTGPGSVLDPLSGMTNAYGVFEAHLTSTQAGPVVVADTALALSATVHFTNPSCNFFGFTNAAGSPFVVLDEDWPVASDSFLATGDFNRDGNLDIAVANVGNSMVNILLGSGDGTFTNAVGSPFSGGYYPIALWTADFNGDGILDLVTVNALGSVASVFLGDGSGGFGAPVPVNVENGPDFVAIGDVNGDGIVDMLITYGSGDTVSVLLGDGTGGFINASGSPMTVSGGADALALGDFNGDGWLDFAVSGGQGGGVSILLGDGSGAFATTRGSPFTVGSRPWAIVTADFTGAGKLDLAVANAEGA